jgi:nitroreductase
VSLPRGGIFANDGASVAETGAIVGVMETWDAIRARRNVRVFADRPIAEHDLDRILEAGRRAPSSRNWQPWDFIVVTERPQLVELANVWVGAAHVAKAAAAIVLVAPEQDDAQKRDWLQFDNGQAMLEMMIAAADLGIGSGHAAVRDQELARELLGFPVGHFCVALMSLGYPADRPLVPLEQMDRRPFDEVVHRGRW